MNRHICSTASMAKVVLNYSAPSCVLKPKVHQLKYIRFVTVDQANKQTKSLKKEKEKVRMYFVQKYIDYVKKYNLVIEKRFPTAMKMYRVFSVGIKDFLGDLKTYISLKLKIARDQGFSQMTRKDIELYQKMPSDMWRIAPVLVLSAIPFGNYIIFPLAFLKPKSLLCSHFWSIEQRAKFSIQDLSDRLRHNKPVFRALQAKLDSVPEGQAKGHWEKIVALLGSGAHPTTDDVLACKELFTKGPYQLNDLTHHHLGQLLKMHGLRKNILRKNKLKHRAFLLLEMDKAIVREGGIDVLNTDTLRNACLIRGLNSTHLSNQDMKIWLQNWLIISREVDKFSYSLILHCPIFFAYNHPQNWMLIY